MLYQDFHGGKKSLPAASLVFDLLYLFSAKSREVLATGPSDKKVERRQRLFASKYVSRGIAVREFANVPIQSGIKVSNQVGLFERLVLA